MGISGRVFVPPHLSLIHVSEQFMFLASVNLYENLILGTTKSKYSFHPERETESNTTRTSDLNGDIGRVQDICRTVGLGENVIAMISEHEEEDDERKEKKEDDEEDTFVRWVEVLTPIELRLLTIARALIADPEVLVLHSPATLLSKAGTEQLFRAFRDCVLHRGTMQAPASYHVRHPRTIIVSHNRLDGLELTDKIFYMRSYEMTPSSLHELRAMNLTP